MTRKTNATSPSLPLQPPARSRYTFARLSLAGPAAMGAPHQSQSFLTSAQSMQWVVEVSYPNDLDIRFE